MTIVRISIRKTLTGGLPAYHRTGSFASEYLVRLDAPFPGPQVNECVRKIVQAEGRLYPACVRFDLVVVKLATPGASGEKLRGQFSRVGLDKLQGQIELGEDDALAFPPVVAVYARSSNRARRTPAPAPRPERERMEPLRPQARGAASLSASEPARPLTVSPCPTSPLTRNCSRPFAQAAAPTSCWASWVRTKKECAA